jgi:hypothetical protein
MRIAIAFGTALAVVLAAPAVWGAAHPTGKHAAAKPAAAKPAPSCAALAFRPLPSGASDGEQTAGMYRSRLARLELRASVQNGAPENYYVIAGGNRLAAAQSLPDAAGNCAALKKMPKPQSAAAACTGDRFTLVVAHAAEKRYALLYAASAGAWRFCNAGTF